MLTWEGNRHLITKIKAAITAGIRPCAMIFHLQPSADWEPFDFKLLEAYQILQDELCPKCGHPIWLCRSGTNRVAFKVRDEVCYADRALEAAKDSRSKEKASKEQRKEWGKFHYVVPYSPPNADGPMPTREEYYKEMRVSRVE